MNGCCTGKENGNKACGHARNLIYVIELHLMSTLSINDVVFHAYTHHNIRSVLIS